MVFSFLGFILQMKDKRDFTSHPYPGGRGILFVLFAHSRPGNFTFMTNLLTQQTSKKLGEIMQKLSTTVALLLLTVGVAATS